MKWTFIVICLIILTGCAQEEIVIGSVLSLSGYAADYGINSQRGISLAVEEINAQGGINGKPVRVIFEDDSTDGVAAATAAHKLINVDQVGVIIGGTWDLSVEPIVPIIEASEVVLITPSTGETRDTRRSNYLFRYWPSIAFTVEQLAEEVNIETEITIITNSGAWGEAHKLAFINNFEVAKTMQVVSADGNDMSSLVAKIETNTVAIALGPKDTAELVKKLKEQGKELTILASEGSVSLALQLGLIRVEDLSEAYYISLEPKEKEFIEKFVKRYGVEPGINADTSYKATLLVLEAYKENKNIREYLDQSGIFENGNLITRIPIIHS